MNKKYYKINIMKKIIGSLMIVTFLLASCDSWIDPEINVDPDNPKDVSLGVLLPAIQGSLGYYYGGIDVVGIQSVWMQQLTGQDRQFVAINNYNIRQSDPNNLWNSMYQGVMMDIKQYMDKASDVEKPERNALGVGKVLMAVSLSLVTDAWGDVPYSEALLGDDNLIPSFDSQESLYAEIDKLLSEAISDLQSDDNTAGITNDYIYGGNPALWMKAAYTLRARYAMRLTKVKSVDFSNVISDIDNGISELSEDMEQPYDESSSAGNNPLYQFIEQRPDYIVNNAFYDELFNAVVDTLIIDEPEPLEDDTIYIHDPRKGMQVWSGNGFWTSEGSSVYFTGLSEALFLKAEAYYRNGDEANAKQALKDAYNESINKYDEFLIDEIYSNELVYSSDFKVDSLYAGYERFLNEKIDASTGEELLELIMAEKYKHMFAHAEPFNDWRRTGYPELTPVVGNSIPRRYPYAQDEVNYNPDNTPSVNVFQRVWWDAE